MKKIILIASLIAVSGVALLAFQQQPTPKEYIIQLTGLQIRQTIVGLQHNTALNADVSNALADNIYSQAEKQDSIPKVSKNSTSNK